MLVSQMLACSTALCIVGCQTPPFREVERISLAGADPQELRARFASRLPERFQLVNSISFHYFGRAFSALGLTRLDSTTKIFTIVGLHPAGGAKLFELKGDATGVEAVFIREEFARRGNFARVVAADTRRIYFDRVPVPSAEVTKGKWQIVFRQSYEESQGQGAGELEYVFAGVDGVLVEKRYYEGDTKIWSVSYYEYRSHEGKLYPTGIVLEHHERGYRLIVRLKEILS